MLRCSQSPSLSMQAHTVAAGPAPGVPPPLRSLSLRPPPSISSSPAALSHLPTAPPRLHCSNDPRSSPSSSPTAAATMWCRPGPTYHPHSCTHFYLPLSSVPTVVRARPPTVGRRPGCCGRSRCQCVALCPRRPPPPCRGIETIRMIHRHRHHHQHHP